MVVCLSSLACKLACLAVQHNLQQSCGAVLGTAGPPVTAQHAGCAVQLTGCIRCSSASGGMQFRPASAAGHAAGRGQRCASAWPRLPRLHPAARAPHQARVHILAGGAHGGPRIVCTRSSGQRWACIFNDDCCGRRSRRRHCPAVAVPQPTTLPLDAPRTYPGPGTEGWRCHPRCSSVRAPAAPQTSLRAAPGLHGPCPRMPCRWGVRLSLMERCAAHAGLGPSVTAAAVR